MHVRVETRKVYVSVRGAKFTKHAAYVGAAKALIAKACREVCDAMGFDCWRAEDPKCRFHKRHEASAVYLGHGEWSEEGGGMEYYAKVLPRLVRFLKFVDARGDGERDAT